MAPLYFLGSNLDLNFFKEKYEKKVEILVKKFSFSESFKLSVNKLIICQVCQGLENQRKSLKLLNMVI